MREGVQHECCKTDKKVVHIQKGTPEGVVENGGEGQYGRMYVQERLGENF